MLPLPLRPLLMPLPYGLLLFGYYKWFRRWPTAPMECTVESNWLQSFNVIEAIFYFSWSGGKQPYYHTSWKMEIWLDLNLTLSFTLVFHLYLKLTPYSLSTDWEKAGIIEFSPKGFHNSAWELRFKSRVLSWNNVFCHFHNGRGGGSWWGEGQSSKCKSLLTTTIRFSLKLLFNRWSFTIVLAK